MVYPRRRPSVWSQLWVQIYTTSSPYDNYKLILWDIPEDKGTQTRAIQGAHTHSRLLAYEVNEWYLKWFFIFSEIFFNSCTKVIKMSHGSLCIPGESHEVYEYFGNGMKLRNNRWVINLIVWNRNCFWVSHIPFRRSVSLPRKLIYGLAKRFVASWKSLWFTHLSSSAHWN